MSHMPFHVGHWCPAWHENVLHELILCGTLCLTSLKRSGECWELFCRNNDLHVCILCQMGSRWLHFQPHIAETLPITNPSTSPWSLSHAGTFHDIFHDNFAFYKEFSHWLTCYCGYGVHESCTVCHQNIPGDLIPRLWRDRKALSLCLCRHRQGLSQDGKIGCSKKCGYKNSAVG